MEASKESSDPLCDSHVDDVILSPDLVDDTQAIFRAPLPPVGSSSDHLGTQLSTITEEDTQDRVGGHVGGCPGITSPDRTHLKLILTPRETLPLDAGSPPNIPANPPVTPAGDSVSSASYTNVTPIESLPEEPEYEIPMSLGSDNTFSEDDDVIAGDDTCCDDLTTHCGDATSPAPVLSPIYSTVIKPVRLKLSKSPSMYTRAGTLSPASAVLSPGVVSSSGSTVVIPIEPVSDHQLELGWIPDVPNKQRCVQVSVMSGLDLRTTRREMLLCDVSSLSEEDRNLTFVNSAGDIVYRTSYDGTVGAYGIILDDEQTLKRTSQRMIRQSRVVGHLYKLESSTSRDTWELREPETGKTNALLKMRKWNGFVTGCVHITRGSKGVVSKGDIRIRRVRGRQSDVVITALLNNQLITTIKRGVYDASGDLDKNIYTLFIAPYIDSAVIISIFTAMSHIQFRFERPRTASNLMAMKLAKEVRNSSKVVGDKAVKLKDSISKETNTVLTSISSSLKEIEPKIASVLPDVKVGSFPPSTPLEVRINTTFPLSPTTKRQYSSEMKNKVEEIKKKYRDLIPMKKQKEKGRDDVFVVGLNKMRKQLVGVRKLNLNIKTPNISKMLSKRRSRSHTVNAEAP